MDRVSTGLKELDNMLGGGFPGKATILLSGSAGTGKTLVGLNFLLEGAAKGEKCCYISLSEDKSDLLRACSEIRDLKKVDKYVNRNLAIEHVMMGKHVTLDYFINIFTSYPNVDRLVIDNLNKLLMFAETKNEYRINLSRLVTYLKEKVNCSVLICEADGEVDTGNGESFECDGVVHLTFLEFEEKPKRILEIRKLRYTSFEPLVPHELVIDSESVKLSKTEML